MVFRKKLKVNGTIEKFKVRLVVKGFKQKEILNCFDTYPLVTRIATNRTLIALTTIYKFDIHQIDVKTELMMSLKKKFLWIGPGVLLCLIKNIKFINWLSFSMV
jgi:hypothetical protein